MMYPQSNGQVQAVNKIIKTTLKLRLELLKEKWVEELPLVLWEYQTTSRLATRKTPFSMAYGVEAMIPIEVEVPSFKYEKFVVEANNQAMADEVEMIEEHQELARRKMMAQK